MKHSASFGFVALAPLLALAACAPPAAEPSEASESESAITNGTAVPPGELDGLVQLALGRPSRSLL